MNALHETIDRRLASERGPRPTAARRQVALVYPSPYPVGMSSLGFQQVLRCLNALPDTMAERAFLPDELADAETPPPSAPVLTYESRRPISAFPVVAFSVAYELEVTGLLSCLAASGIPLLASERGPRDPWIVVGGPLTFSNPAPLAPFADVIVMGEAEGLLAELMDTLWGGGTRAEVLRELAQRPGYFIPTEHGDALPPVAKAAAPELPAWSPIIAAEAVLSSMFLIEPERGCSRGCTFCVMRRTTNGGMRTVPIERVLELIPAEARRVGLVGAAVSDHPKIVELVQQLVDRGLEVGLSSLRADRLTPAFVEALVRGGYQTLTVASDGASERLRDQMEKKIGERHLLRAAELARDHGVRQLKNYMMVGIPGETEADIDELIAFTRRQAEVAGRGVRVSLGVAPLVAKRNTPLDRVPFVGIREAERRLERMRAGLQGVAQVRPVSARWAWVEWHLAQGTRETGLAALEAWRAGGRFGDWRRALRGLEERSQRDGAEVG